MDYQPDRNHRHNLGATLAAFFAATMMVFSPYTTAWAAPPKRVLTLPIQPLDALSRARAAEVDGAWLTVLGLEPTLNLLRPADLADHPELAQAQEARIRADKKANEARDATNARQWDKALALWDEALEALEKAVLTLDQPTPFVQAYLGRAEVYYRYGYDDNGDEELAKAFALDPEAPLPDPFPDSAKKNAPRLRQRASSGGIDLAIRANIPLTQVFIDGRHRGSTPIVLDNLARGSHLLRVEGRGHRPHVELLNLQHGALTKNIQLIPLETKLPTTFMAAIEKGGFNQNFLDEALRLSVQHHLDAILIPVLRTDQSQFELAVFRWDRQSQQPGLVSPTALPAQRDRMQTPLLGLAERVLSDLRSAPNAPVTTTPPPFYRPHTAHATQPPHAAQPTLPPTHPADPSATPPTDDDTAFYESWWFWTIIGVVVIGGAGAAYHYLYDGQAGDDGFQTVVTW